MKYARKSLLDFSLRNTTAIKRIIAAVHQHSYSQTKLSNKINTETYTSEISETSQRVNN